MVEKLPKKGVPSERHLAARGLLPKVRKPSGKRCEVYFIKAATLGLIKIGKADNARTRFQNLRTMSPDALVLLGVLVCNDGGSLERRLHRLFAAHRSHGEWFRPADEIIDFIAANVSTPAARTSWRVIRNKAA